MKKKLLIIDDDMTLLRLLRQWLEKSGYEVICATEGIEGLREMYSHQPDLVILDIMMPGMDGWEVCSRIRQMSDIPVIMLTAKDAETDKIRGFQLGSDDYVTKPFSFAELTARVGAVLQRANRHAYVDKPRIYSAKDLIIDMNRHRVAVRGKEVELTPTEFRLLAVLAEAEGSPVSIQQILTKVWGPEYSQETEYVKGYIWYLRRKIEENPSQPQYIITVRGFGYRLEMEQQ